MQVPTFADRQAKPATVLHLSSVKRYKFIYSFSQNLTYIQETKWLEGWPGLQLLKCTIPHYRIPARSLATTLRYPDEVKDPSHFAELKNLPEAGEEELAMMTKIVDKMTKDMDLRLYHDGYKQRIEALITSKMKGEVAQVEEKKPKRPAAKSMMEMLREQLNP